MAVFTIQGPDGKTYRVQGNDQAGAINFLKSQIGSQQNAVSAPTAELNPDGTGVSRAIQRGALQTAAAVPTMAATADIRAISDQDRLASAEEKRGIIYDELKRAGVPAQAFASRGVNLDDPQNVVALMQQYSVPPAAQANFSQVVEKRLDNASQVDTAAATQRAQSNLAAAGALQDKAAALPKSETASRYEQSLAEAPDSFKGWLGSITNDPVGFMAWAGETLSESGPSIAGGLATTAVAGPVAGSSVLALGGLSREYSNEVNKFLKEKGVNLSDPNSAKALINNPQAMDEANQRGLTRGLVIAMFELAGQGAVASKLFGKTLARRTVSQATTEGGGEAAATASVGDDVSIKEALAEGVVGAGTAIPEAAIAGKNKLFTSDGKLNVNNLDNTTKLAAASLAQRLRTLSQNNSYNLKDVKKDGGAKQTLESAHEAITGEMKAIVTNPAVKGYLDPKQAKTLEELIDKYAKAQTAIRQTRNKVKSKVDQENYEAILDALPAGKERDQIANLMRESNVLTDLFRSGTKGGVSSFTDTFNPFAREDGSYDPSRMISAGLNKGTAILSAGSSLPIQFGVVAGGRTIDAVTRRRAAIDRFVRKNEGKTPLQDPTGPSLVEAEAERQAQAEQLKFEDDQMGLELGKLAQSDKDTSPVGTVLLGTGLDRDGLRAAMSELEALNPDIKALKDVFTDIRKNMDGGTNKIRRINDIIPIINHHLNTPDTTVQRQANPDQLLAQRAGVNLPNVDQSPPAQTQAQTAAPGQPRSESSINADFDALAIEKKQLEAQASSIQDEISNLSLEEAQARKQEFAARMAPIQQRLADISSQMDSLGTENQARRSGNQFTTPENYQAGKSDNNAFVRNLESKLADDTTLAPLDKAQLATALADMQASLGPNPVEAMTEMVEDLGNMGVSQEAIDTYVKPYADRVIAQQARVGRMQAPETEDRPRFAKVAPVPFNNDRMQQMFGVEDPTPGGNYIDLDTKEDLTGNTYAGGKVSIVDGKPVLDTSDDFSEPATKADGRKVKVNLFKQKAGWKWIDYDGPATIVSTEVGGKHHYALSSDFQNPVTLQTYPNQPSEPRLRPTTQGEVELGNKIGNISVRGKIHPVYDEVRIVSKSPERPRFAKDLNSASQKPTLQTYVNPLNVPTTEINATRLNESPSEADIQKMREGSYKPTKKRNLVEAADYMHQKWKEATGRSEPFEYTPENVDIISTYMATEAANALQSDANAIGWYDRKLKAAKRVVSLVDPRVTQSPDAEAAFDFALAVTSNGQAVADNFQYALEVFRHFMDNGKMPTDTWIKGGERNAAMLEAFDFFNAYQSSGANMPIQDFMDQDFTVNELNSYISRFNAQYGTEIKVPSSEGANSQVKGSYIIGPKIGQGFYQNIRGNYDPLTMDIWWMRMWNRLVGRPFVADPDLDQGRSNVKGALKTVGKLEQKMVNQTLKEMGVGKRDINKDPALFDDFVTKVEKRYQKFYKQYKEENGVNHTKPNFFKKTGTHVKNLKPQLQAQPKGPSERAYMRDVTKAAIAKLSDLGYNIETADFQALMWYPEKQLFRHLGVAPGRGSDNDYLDAAIMLAEGEGIANDQIQEALPDADGDGAVNNQPSTPRGDEGLYRGDGSDGPSQEGPRFNQQPTGVAGILAQRIQGSQDGPTPRGAIPSTQEVKLEAPTVRAAIEIGKPGSAFENGIPQGLESAKRFAKAADITLQFVEDNEAMLDAARITGEDRDAGKNASGVYNKYGAFVMKPGSKLPSSDRFISDFEAYVTAFHETMHGLSGTDLDGRDVPEALISKNYLTGEVDYAAPRTFDGLIGQLVNTPGVNSNNVIKDILKIQDEEVFANGDNVQPVRISGPAKRILGVIPDMAERAEVQAEIDRFEKYSRSVSELAVDALTFYGMDPKRMKKEYPHAAKAVREFFKNSSKVQFFSHPLAMAFAVVMAMLMKQEQAEEEQERQQQQMPPGALNQPMPQGLLSA